MVTLHGVSQRIPFTIRGKRCQLCAMVLLLIAGFILQANQIVRAGEKEIPFSEPEIVDSEFRKLSVGRVSLPVIRIVTNSEGRLDLSEAKLRTIDGDESESESIVQSSRPGVDPSAKRPLDKLFRVPDFSTWISANFGQRKTNQALYSLNDSNGFVVQPVRRISIPNPLALIGNPFRWTGRFRAEYGDNFDDTNHIRGNLIVNSGLPIGFDTEFAYRHDDVRRRGTNHLWTGDFNFIYRFGKIRNAEIRAGLGVNWLTGGNSTEVGFNSTYGVDIYLARPWIISTSFDWGTLGSESLFHFRITGGLDFGRFEIFAGYDFYEIGNLERKNIVAGLGMWF